MKMRTVAELSAGVAIAARPNPRQRVVHLLAVFALLLAAATPAFAQSVAMVTDLTGKAVLQGAHGKVNLTMLTELAGDARVQLDGGARLTALYLGSGDEYVFSGPAQIQFRAAAPQVLSGAAPQKRASASAKAGKQVTIRLSSVTQAGLVMRSRRTTGRIPLLTLVGTKTLESSPEFRWRETSPVPATASSLPTVSASRYTRRKSKARHSRCRPRCSSRKTRSTPGRFRRRFPMAGGM